MELTQQFVDDFGKEIKERDTKIERFRKALEDIVKLDTLIKRGFHAETMLKIAKEALKDEE